MPDKHTDIERFLTAHADCALIQITEAKGSTPRETGTWMLAAQHEIFGTIGGGQLEYMAIDQARQMLKDKNTQPKDMHIPLGPDIGQCCGGMVKLKVQLVHETLRVSLKNKVEIDKSTQEDIYIFGAGHVGFALAQALSLLPFKTTLIDTRETEIRSAPDTISAQLVAMPETIVRTARPKSAFIILTHDHALDFIIAREAIARHDAAYIGMIGSKTKRATFKNWLKREDGHIDGFDRLICPVGSANVKDKRPEIIAALTCAEVIAAFYDHKAMQQHHASRQAGLTKVNH